MDSNISHPLVSPYFLKIMPEIREALLEEHISCRMYLGSAEPAFDKDGSLSCHEVLEDARLNRLKGLIAFHTKRHDSWVAVMENKSIPILDTKQCWNLALYVHRATTAMHVMSAAHLSSMALRCQSNFGISRKQTF
ncbi:MAG: hypothetical protein ACK5LK_07715 [Chthoniobacterales bacterium]